MASWYEGLYYYTCWVYSCLGAIEPLLTDCLRSYTQVEIIAMTGRLYSLTCRILTAQLHESSSCNKTLTMKTSDCRGPRRLDHCRHRTGKKSRTNNRVPRVFCRHHHSILLAPRPAKPHQLLLSVSDILDPLRSRIQPFARDGTNG